MDTSIDTNEEGGRNCPAKTGDYLRFRINWSVPAADWLKPLIKFSNIFLWEKLIKWSSGDDHTMTEIWLVPTELVKFQSVYGQLNSEQGTLE